MRFFKSRRYIARYTKLAAILWRYGASAVVRAAGLPFRWRRTDEGPSRQLLRPIDVRNLLTELGPVFVKFGQMLGTRPDLIPSEYVEELIKLQDQAEPVPFEAIAAIIEQDLKGSLEELFDELDPKPLAAASLAQVHKGRLHTGETVVVKVLKPGARETAATDTAIIRSLARWMEENIPSVATYDLQGVAEEFANALADELDFSIEAHYSERLRHNISQATDEVIVPRIFLDYSSDRVLTEEFLEGIKITDVVTLEKQGQNREHLAQLFARTLLRQIYVDGFFHADPHPGNVLVMPDGKLGLVDCGAARGIPERMRSALVGMLLAFAGEDAELFAELMTEVSAVPRHFERQRFQYEVEQMFAKFQGVPSARISLANGFNKALLLCKEFSLRAGQHFALLAKVWVNVEGICRTLAPDFNVFSEAEGLIWEALKSELKPADPIGRSYDFARKSQRLIARLPRDLDGLLNKLRDDNFLINLEPTGIEEPLGRLERTTNRLALALTSGALAVTSTLLAHVDTGILLKGHEISHLLGALGLAGSLILGGSLLWHINRSGGLS